MIIINQTLVRFDGDGEWWENRAERKEKPNMDG